MSNVTNLFILRNIQEALDDSDWKTTVMEEINALEKNETCNIVYLPKAHKLVGFKWVFTMKLELILVLGGETQD